MARTTPAQKPRGEQSTIFSGGLAGIRADLGPNHPWPAGKERSKTANKDLSIRTWDRFWALSRPFYRPLRGYPPTDYIRGIIPVIADDYRLRLRKRWAKRKGDMP